MTKRNHKPERTCLGCNRRDLKETMVRIAALAGAVALDREHRLRGRGGYVHRAQACLEGFDRRAQREIRSFKCRVSLGERRRLIELIQDAAG